jgi:cupin fold WbuC family metalloprotein
MLNVPNVQVIDEQLFDEVAARAKASARLRMNHNFHGDATANPHRFLNVLLEGTYIRPHRHLSPPKSEAFIVLEGCADLIIFDEAGQIKERYSLGQDGNRGKVWGIDLAPGVWHTVVVTSKRAVCYEVKPGPWDPASDKEFAPWAPREEESTAAAEFLNRLVAEAC